MGTARVSTEAEGRGGDPESGQTEVCVADAGSSYTARGSCGTVSPVIGFTQPLRAPFAAQLLRNFAQLETLLEGLGR